MDPSIFGLNRAPFDNTPNPAHFVNLAPHRQAIETLQHAIDQRKGIVIVTGAPGTGKTLMGRMLKQRCGVGAAVAVVTRPCTDAADLWSAISDGFRLNSRPGSRIAQDLERFAEQLYQQDVPAVLIVEDAHDLPDDCLDLVRRIAAMEADDMPLVQIVLLGWPKLAARFMGLAGAAMQQRIHRHVKMEPLSERDTIAYIRGQIRLAGGPEEGIFSEAAMQVVHRRTGGIPRLINWLCDALLNEAAEAGVIQVEADRAEAIAFDMAYDPELFQAQLTADEAGVLFNAQLKEHPVIRDLLERLDRAEAGVTQCAGEAAQMREREPQITRQFRRYDRVFERMVPMLRSLQRYRQESEAALTACREACERLEEMLRAPESVLHEARRLTEEMQGLSQDVRGLLGEAGEAKRELEQRLADCENAGRRMIEEREETLPVMDRTRRMLGLLRKVHHITNERCQRLDGLTARAHEMCEAIPGRIAKMEAALAGPAQMLEQMRAAEKTLRRHVEAGERQSRDVERALEQAAHTARRMREEIEQARTEDESQSPTHAARGGPSQRAGPAAESTESAPSDLARRVRALQGLVRGLRRTPGTGGPRSESSREETQETQIQL
jgi:type II secretory pathway predicted ATPase ExeA